MQMWVHFLLKFLITCRSLPLSKGYGITTVQCIFLQEAILRVQDLQDLGLLTGVIDDRGKLIYISEEELQGVAKYIKERGRVSICDLAEASNVLVSLTQ